MGRTTQHASRAPRTAVIVDLENLVTPSYGAAGSIGAAHHLRWTFRYLASRAELCWAVTSCHGDLAAQLVVAISDVRLRVRRNPRTPNAADEALIRRGADVPASTEQVVLLTGDDDFLPLVRSLQARGLRVVVASAPDRCSRALREAADEHWPLPTWAMLEEWVLAV